MYVYVCAYIYIYIYIYVYIYIYIYIMPFWALPPRGQKVGGAVWSKSGQVSTIIPVAIFYLFSQFCEIDMSLLSL